MDNRYWIIGAIIAIVVVGGIGGYFLLGSGEEEETVYEKETPQPVRTVIGTSVEGRDIEVFRYGEGDTHLAFIAGIHGGYEWNTVVLAERFMDYLNKNPEALPRDIRVSVIPIANPDGVAEVFGDTNVSVTQAPATEETTSGRFNAHDVDLNRNFDCNWQPASFWRGQEVNAGSEAFSEPEAQAIRDFVLDTNPSAVIFWHSAANGVYGATCNGDGTGSELSFAANELMNTYANASGYPAIATFDHYEITGDAEGWLAKKGIPSVSVELKTHETVEWEENMAGIKAVIEEYSNP